MRLRTLVLSSLLLALPTFAHASTIYSYKGTTFTSFYNGSNGIASDQPYNSSDFISGSFTLSSPLHPNMDFTVITPDSFSFTDQLFTISNDPKNDPSLVSAFFQVSTDASGNVLGCNIALGGASGLQTMQIVIYQVEADYPQSAGINFQVGPIGTLLKESSGESYTSGTWTTSTSAISSTPEPSSLILLGTGCLATLGAVRRRLRS